VSRRDDATTIPSGLRGLLARLYPTFELVATKELAPDSGATRSATQKAVGYGRPLRVALRSPQGESLEVVWRLASANQFGHDRRADRAGNLLLAFDDFVRIPEHVEAIDVGTIDRDGELISVRAGGEFYLLTTYARGAVYAEDLRAVAASGEATPLDQQRAGALARYLAQLHEPMDEPLRYRRAIRDLIGHGEGIYGVIDGYPANVPGAPIERLARIERACAEWRWRLRDKPERLTRTHGDFHPFNLVFDQGSHFQVLDASRGTCGDPADDVTALSINYPLFAFDSRARWRDGLGKLWHLFWDSYRQHRADPDLLECAPPYWAWRALVVCNPVFYPQLSEPARNALLGLAERALHEGRLDPRWADELFP
jgi:Phosphotransferase enzyme family